MSASLGSHSLIAFPDLTSRSYAFLPLSMYAFVVWVSGALESVNYYAICRVAARFSSPALIFGMAATADCCEFLNIFNLGQLLLLAYNDLFPQDPLNPLFLFIILMNSLTRNHDNIKLWRVMLWAKVRVERGQHVVFNIDQIVVIVCEMHTNVYMMKVRRE